MAGEGKANGNLGVAYNSLGEFRMAIKYHLKYLEIAMEIGDKLGEKMHIMVLERHILH